MLTTLGQYDQERAKVGLPKAAVPRSISEVESLAASCGKTATRLCGLRDLIKELPQLGKVRAVTGNRYVVHEKIGQYQNIKLWNYQGLVCGDAINLRLFLNHWHYGFAVKEKCDDGFRHSLQFFDRNGFGVHRIYLTADSNWEAYENLITCYRSADQEPRQSVAPVPQLPLRADGEIDVTLLRQSWLALQDIHDLSTLFRNFGITRIQGLRLAGRDLAAPVALSDARILMEVLRDTALPVVFYVSSLGAVQIHAGRVKYLSPTGPWCIVLDTDFILRMRGAGVASAWIIRKPMGGSTSTCLELYNRAGENILQIFSQCSLERAEEKIWQCLLAALETTQVSI
jgi:putative hemin transport protein